MTKKFRLAVALDIIAENYADAEQMIMDTIKSKLPSEETGFIGITIFKNNSIEVKP